MLSIAESIPKITLRPPRNITTSVTVKHGPCEDCKLLKAFLNRWRREAQKKEPHTGRNLGMSICYTRPPVDERPYVKVAFLASNPSRSRAMTKTPGSMDFPMTIAS